ncbi:EthD domain-containing protein [Streptomyces sp. NPDC002623]
MTTNEASNAIVTCVTMTEHLRLNTVEGAAMPLFVEWMRRKPGLSQEEFTAYWRDHHAPIVRDRPDVRSSLMADSYTHYRTRSDDELVGAMIAARGMGVETYDGVCIPRSSSVAFDEYAQALSDPTSSTVGAWTTLLEDEVNFMDLSTSVPCFAEEDIVISSESPVTTHLMVCIRRSDGVSTENFLEFKRKRSADHVSSLRDQLGFAEYRQTVPIDTPLNDGFRAVRGCEERHFDAMDVFGFASRDDLAVSWDTQRGAWEELARREDGVIDLERSTLVIADKFVIFDDQ